MPKGLAECYHPGCQMQGTIQCRAILACKDYGCGVMMCDEHRSKKCIKRARHRGPGWGPRQYVCVACEDNASRCTLIIFLVPLIVALIAGAVVCLFLLVINKDESE